MPFCLLLWKNWIGWQRTCIRRYWSFPALTPLESPSGTSHCKHASSWKMLVYHLFHTLLDFNFPAFCRSCGRPLILTLPLFFLQTPTHHVGSPSQRPAPVNPAMVAQQPQMVPAGPMVPTPDQLAKLRSEFDIVQQNCKVFSEMLTEMSSGQEHPSDVELLMVRNPAIFHYPCLFSVWSAMFFISFVQELNRTCRQMQQRLVELVERVQNEEVTGIPCPHNYYFLTYCIDAVFPSIMIPGEILHINDELNNVFLRFDRYERLRGGAAYQNAAQTTPAQPAAATPQLPPPYPVSSSHFPSAPPSLPWTSPIASLSPYRPRHKQPILTNPLEIS